MVSSSLVMVIAADKPFKTFAEFVEHARKNPGKLNFSSIGTAASQHLTGELFAMATKTDVVHIPYKATPSALADIISGTIDFCWDFSIVMKPLIDGGKLRAIAVRLLETLLRPRLRCNHCDAEGPLCCSVRERLRKRHLARRRLHDDILRHCRWCVDIGIGVLLDEVRMELTSAYYPPADASRDLD